MSEKALGLIETRGLIPAIEAADISLKTANVTVDGLVNVGAGLVAITMRGDVSSVQAAVEAGADAARRQGTVISTTVIARTAEGLDRVIDSKFVHGGNCKKKMEREPGSPIEAIEQSVPAKEQLDQMSVMQLRSLAREFDDFPMSREKIRSARKRDLIENILKYYEKRGMSHG